MSYLVEDCLRIIFIELKYVPNSLYSCILVNRFWCIIGVQILWEKPYEFLLNHRNLKKVSYRVKNLQFIKFYNTIIDLLPISSKNSYQRYGLELIKESIYTNDYQKKYNILEQEYYKLFINNCKNITDFRWCTTLPLYQYPGASTCFSQLRTLYITDNQSWISDKLLGMSQICQDIENLELLNCDRDTPGLIKFIDNQKNLQSLHLNNYECLAEKLKLRIYLYPSEQDIQEWNKYLLISSFPKLQYLETQYLSPHGVCRLIENSQNIKEINTRNHFLGEEAIYNIKLFKVIAKNCPNIESLSVNTYLKNLGGVKEIILNCNKLRELDISINFEDDAGNNHEREIICDEILNYLLNYSPRNFDEFSFNERWRFSVNNLKNFFEGWRGRKPIEFNPRFDKCDHFTQKHIEIVQKYYDEGNIISILQEVFDQLNVLKSIHIFYYCSLNSDFVQQIIKKFGDYLENFGFGHSNSCDGYLKLKRQLLKLIMEYCTKIRYFDSGQVLPPKLEYLSLSLSFNNNLSDLEIFFKNSQNIFIKKLLIIYGPNYIIESLLFYIKEYIMKKERVKYLAITSYDGDYELFPLKDEVNEFKLHNIIVKKFYDSMIYIVVHIVL
ncbi:hypothetical protein RhiirA1_456168 [Rhizophagus irregularis]|uniref:F-box domain-containing protein n=1 Tax=Rhizophagus irregularis TaxID=588596 RepID=A0A2N0S1A8_9GLOM|nr:hypothetical protein RhiirA1_456168 [Rhizophagus irregularis]